MLYIFLCIDAFVPTQMRDFYWQLGVMSHIEVSYFEEKLGDRYSHYWEGTEIYQGFNYLSTTDTEGDWYTYPEY